jgi:hypothetical protein
MFKKWTWQQWAIFFTIVLGDGMKSKYFFLAAFFFVVIHFGFSQTANNVNGTWVYEYSDTNEDIGEFFFTSTLIVKGKNYMLYQERIRVYGIHWDHCEIGSIVISGNEITLYPEALSGLFEWRKPEAGSITKYRYALNGNDLVIMQNNSTEVYRKSPQPDQNRLLIYSGTMSGAQTLNIKLVIGDLNNVYYRYVRNGTAGDPIALWGRIEDGILILREQDENNKDRAVMRFYNFNPNANTITGVWQDARPGREANTYEIRLSK